jgi:hypothetical protein
MASSKTTESTEVPPAQEPRAVYEVRLDEKHKNDGVMQSEAYKAGSTMQKVLASKYFPPGEGTSTLKVTILSVSKGSRWGRICCGEVGVGWAVLKSEWCLTRDGKNLTPPKIETTRDSGAAGTKDANAEYGENQIVDDLARAAGDTIGPKATAALLQIDK